MKNIKTYEGFLDFFKKKEKIGVSFNDIMECLYDLTDEYRIENQLNGVKVDAIFASQDDVFRKSGGLGLDNDHDALVNDELYRNKNFKIKKNSIAFNFTYCPDKISDEEVNELLLDCKSKLKIHDCQISFFIGWGYDEGGSSSREWFDFMSMINRTIKKTWAPDRCRNITVKIKSSGGFS